MDATAAIRALAERGVRVTPLSADLLRAQDGTLYRIARRPNPAAVRELRDQHPDVTIIAPVVRTTAAMRELAALDGRVMLITQPPRPSESTAGKRGPAPRTQWAAARALLAHPGRRWSQRELAAAAGVSSGAVNSALNQSLAPFVRMDVRWSVVDPEGLWDWLASVYRPAETLTTYWWRDDALDVQADSVVAADPAAVLTGDLAADRYFGWRRPEHAMFYSNLGAPDMAALGFAMDDEGGHTIALSVPSDKSVPAQATTIQGVQCADPFLVAWDVQRTGTTGDHDEAARMIRDETIRRFARV
ncbi:hypothetical protein [Microbacterium marinilacus]|uniref:XRE family transcriptional regulator n=1 Tax=Microbacterium marinilacus TaxID=415209 RepID=A0ABP7BSK9_9MICO|nr:hypothetical protein [Microbacterium marinilacus]MBY0687723.1 hypothetical protein [Microbacterium marinilacus]